jgi:exodeoxyribonuclease V alpha subunit
MITTKVFNGDIGFIKNIDLSEQNLTVDIDGREVQFEFSELDILALAYAISVHKSQGSEYPVIILPISMQHFVMLKRNLLYTGVTRGKRMVILIGEKKAVETALLTRNQGKRWNKLSDRIADSFKNIRK